MNELTQLRLLRHFFLRTYGLPELFPFSKYLRQAQGNMISHMIEVEVSTWMTLLAIAWGLERVAFMIYAVTDTIEENFSIVLAFQGLTWAAVVLHFLTLLYLEWGICHLRKKAVKHGEQQQSHHHRQTRLECLKEVADLERETVDHEKAMDAIAVMERVREREQRHQGKRTRCFLIRHDTGFQLIFMICKNVL